jgi:hypothetical protein
MSMTCKLHSNSCGTFHISYKEAMSILAEGTDVPCYSMVVYHESGEVHYWPVKVGQRYVFTHNQYVPKRRVG